MKTKLLKLSFFTVMLIIFLGCCEECEKDKNDHLIKLETCHEELQSLKSHLDAAFVFAQNIPAMFDFCNTTQSIIPNNDFNTETGIANFSIPIPKGSNIKFIKKDNDTLFYECNGHGKINYSDHDLINENKTVSGLPRKEGHRIWVLVKFKNFKENTCSELKIYQEKKKSSEVQGHPLTLEPIN